MLISGGWTRDKVCQALFPTEFKDLAFSDLDLVVPKGTGQDMVNFLKAYKTIEDYKKREVFVSETGTQIVHNFKLTVNGTQYEVDIKENINPYSN